VRGSSLFDPGNGSKSLNDGIIEPCGDCRSRVCRRRKVGGHRSHMVDSHAGSSCCSFARLLNRSVAPQISTTEIATSAMTIVRRVDVVEPDDPRAARFNAFDRWLSEVFKDGGRQARIKTAIAAAAAEPSTRRSRLGSAVNGNDGANHGVAARSST
jgi:hypothetical protein